MRKIVMSSVAVTSALALSACGGEAPAGDDAAPAEEVVEEVVEEVEPEPVVAVTFADLTGDAGAGETVFAQCRTCHLIEEGRNGVGPSLYGVIGREAGSIEGFNYSDANANSGLTWTPEIMFDYLEAPREYMPGTRMAYPGLKDPQDRADLIAYLESAATE
ncbi:MAG: cytochrome c family protein [Pseudomonadota bacterium]